jgi:REP element-mobilizing transposase RayT
MKLRQAVFRYDLSLLDYCLTSNHVHLLLFAEDVNQISEFMQMVAGEFEARAQVDGIHCGGIASICRRSRGANQRTASSGNSTSGR